MTTQHGSNNMVAPQNREQTILDTDNSTKGNLGRDNNTSRKAATIVSL